MANLIYKLDETSTTWTDTTGDLAMTLNNLASGSGRQGAQLDLGAPGTARSRIYQWWARVRFATTPVVGEPVRIYLKLSDGTRILNDDGTGDIALSAKNKLRNLHFIGSIIVDEAATGVDMVAHGSVEINARYVNPVFWNATADNLVATNNLNDFVLTPTPDQIQ